MHFIKGNLAVGLLLFALFLGAGNIIFPPLLGQQAGENITVAMIGFLITGVGLPLLAIVAVAKAEAIYNCLLTVLVLLLG